MALQPCKECKSQISSEAKACPQCGHPVEPPGSAFMQILLLLGILGIGLTFWSRIPDTNSKAAAPPQEPPAPIVITANRLYAEYDANEARADAQFKGRLLVISGSVANISKTVTGSVVVQLATTSGVDVSAAIQKRGSNEKVMGLNKGADVKLQCKGGGMFIATPMLDDCTIL